MLKIKYTKKMKQGIKRLIKRGKDISKLNEVLKILAAQNPLPKQYLDHKLTGTENFRECHIEPDWLLIYRIFADKLILSAIATVTHRETLNME
ncbi:MAG: type II toxin-antitoxin system YafQ family toxin [Chitinivibrionia bacterium]|nr:type II toxin-antitoxin system YafQ family toxin [Chitinivibrionia bacterium]